MQVSCWRRRLVTRSISWPNRTVAGKFFDCKFITKVWYTACGISGGGRALGSLHRRLSFTLLNITGIVSQGVCLRFCSYVIFHKPKRGVAQDEAIDIRHALLSVDMFPFFRGSVLSRKSHRHFGRPGNG